MSFKLKGSTTASAKVKRTNEEKIAVLHLMSEGKSAKEALAEVFEDTLTPAMEKHPHSIISGFKKTISKELEKDNREVIDLLVELGMVDEVEDEETQETIEE